MRGCTLLFLCLFSGLLSAAQQQDDLAYSLGARLGERLHNEVPGLDVQALLDGLGQAYRNEPLRLSKEQIERQLEQHEQRLQEREARTQKEQAQRAQQQFLEREKSRPGTRELTGGVLVQELRAGSGKHPQAGSRVQVRYRGELADGSVFDQSGSPQWFRLDSLIRGWQTALQAMPTGAKWRVVIPSEQGYGNEGAGDLIPPDAPLVFEVELLDVAD